MTAVSWPELCLKPGTEADGFVVWGAVKRGKVAGDFRMFSRSQSVVDGDQEGQALSVNLRRHQGGRKAPGRGSGA